MAAPLISISSPYDGEPSVYLNKQIQITFDQAMIGASINKNTILLYRSSDYLQIEGIVTYDTTTFTATFLANRTFDENSAYSLCVVGSDQSSDCVKNVLGECLAATANIEFSTGSTFYVPPVTTPTPTPAYVPVTPDPTVPVLQPAVQLDFAVIKVHPENRKSNLGTILPSGWLNILHPSGHVFIYEPPGSSNIYIQFNHDLYPSGTAYVDWITIEASPVNGDPMFPAAVPSGYVLPPSGDTLRWICGDPSGWYQNNEILVTLSEWIMDASGNYLGEDRQYMFTTAYNPMYCSVQKVRMAIGPYIREVPDDTINRTIFNNSLLAYQLANETYGQHQWDIESPPWAAKMYTCCKTQYDLLNAELLNRIGMAGQLKTLGDFTVQDQLDLSKSLKPAMDQALACIQFWVDRLVGIKAKAHPKMAIKGINNGTTPLIRGVRTWGQTTYTQPFPAANTRPQRALKLPNVYAKWS